MSLIAVSLLNRFLIFWLIVFIANINTIRMILIGDKMYLHILKKPMSILIQTIIETCQ
jgi:hypothetical protein